MNNNNTLLLKNFKRIKKICPVVKIQIYNSDLTILIKANLLLNMLLFFKNHILFQYKILTCISGVDYPNNKYRFKLIYELLSVRYNNRIRIKILTHELMPVDSCDSIYPTAGWFECEIWDMFGVFFKNHLNLKRILTDYGFNGYPLRKDFPLSGFLEVHYNEIEKRVVNESIELSQEYRTFNYLSSWQVQKI
jgi:NADH/F420H2 dehydrogenase subunit C